MGTSSETLLVMSVRLDYRGRQSSTHPGYSLCVITGPYDESYEGDPVGASKHRFLEDKWLISLDIFHIDTWKSGAIVKPTSWRRTRCITAHLRPDPSPLDAAL